MKAILYFFIFYSSLIFSQQLEKVDFKILNAVIEPNAINKTVSGNVVYEFEVLSKTKEVYVDAVNMEFSEVKINGKKVKYENTGEKLIVFKKLKKGKYTLSFNYKATPKQTLYFVGEGDDLQIWTQGQGKNTSHWLPSFNDVNEKVIFNISVNFRNDFEVLSNGKMIVKEFNSKGSHLLWKYQMQKPMSSYLVMLAIGKFDKKTDTTSSGTTLEYYLDRNDIAKFEPTYRYSKPIFEFLENEIGVAYPWKVYRQVPVKDFLYAGMENTSATIFSQDFVVDSIGFNDRNYLNVNAHELAHQWFGDFITAKESKHHWLQEGFATYYALLAEQSVFGDDYFNYQLLEMANQLENAERYDTIPILNEKASSLTFYKKGAWALHALRSEIGAEKFKLAVKSYLEKFAFKNVDTDEFLAEIKSVSNFDVEKFKNDWLLNPYFNYEVAVQYLNNNSFITIYNDLLSKSDAPFEVKIDEFERIMQSNVYYPVKVEILHQCKNIKLENKQKLIELALATDDVKVLQAVAETVDYIPRDFKTQYESLLQDKSYITREIALFRLWQNFRENQLDYITLSNNWIGLDYNLKIANLTLNVVTKSVDFSEKQKAISELEEMTKLPYEFKVREAAMETILNLKLPSNQVYLSLIDATMHHKWQLVKFGKDKIRALLSNDVERAKIIDLQAIMSDKQKERLAVFLKEIQ